MQTQYIGRLSNNISIESFIIKQPSFKDYELLYHDEEGILKSYYKSVTKELSYDVSFLTNVIFTSDVAIDEYYTTNTESSKIENNIALVQLNKNTKYLYIPVLKYIKNLAFDRGLKSDIKHDAWNVLGDETIRIININNANIPCREISISYNNSTPIDVNIYFDDVSNHYNNKNNPHNITPSQIGLGNVDNTSDKDKPISDKTMEWLKDRDRIIKDKIEQYFNTHNKHIIAHRKELSAEFNKHIDAFKRDIVDNAKQQLEDVKKLGNIDNLIETKFNRFKDQSNVVLKAFIEKSNITLNELKNVLIEMEKHKQDFKDNVEQANIKYDTNMARYERRINAIEQQLSEVAHTIRKMRQ